MKPKLKKVTNLIIIDASGSMSSKKEEVIGGLKQLFELIRSTKSVKQRTVVLDFSGAKDVRVLVDTDQNPEDLLAEGYSVRGMTALYDAIGYGFSLVEKDKNVFVNILTDGDENDSKEYKYSDIKDLITTKQKEKNWVVTFMGTTIDSIERAKSMGVHSGNTTFFADNGSGVSKSRGISNKAYANYASSLTSGSNISLSTLMQDAEKEVEK